MIPLVNLLDDVATPVWNITHNQHIPSDVLMRSVVWEEVPKASSSDIIVAGSSMLQYEQIYIQQQGRLLVSFNDTKHWRCWLLRQPEQGEGE